MADLFAADYKQKPLHSGDFGNGYKEDYTYQRAGVANTDKIYFGVIPAGTRVTEVEIAFDDCGTSCNLDIGFEPDTPDGPAANLTYWATDIDVATAAGRFRSNAHPITFERDVRLVGTVGGAGFTGSPRVSVVVGGKVVGVR